MWLEIGDPRGNQVCLRWGDEGLWAKYYVSLDNLQRAAGEVRTGLARLTRWAASKQREELPLILHELTTAGFHLYYALFDAKSNRNAAYDVQDWMRQAYEKQKQKNQEDGTESAECDLSVVADPSMHVPWGLVFEADDPPGLQPDVRSAAFGNFWGLKYELAAVFDGVNPSDALARPAKQCRLLSLLHRDYADEAHARLGNLLGRPLGIKLTYELCREALRNIEPGDTIFHYIGHHHDGVLDLGYGAKVSMTDFKILMDELTGGRRRMPGQWCGLLFINGCEGAFGDGDYSFADVANREGLFGLISTESIVPKDDAIEFSRQFLTALFDEGKTIGQTMHHLRRDESMWPLSLLYSCYAQPKYKIVPEIGTPAAQGTPA